MADQRVDIERAWKDKEYYNSLTSEEKAMVPANPAGPNDLADNDLESISGGAEAITLDGGTCGLGTIGCCTTECSKWPNTGGDVETDA